MAENLVTGLSFTAAFGAALVGGVFFAFSNFIMAGLGRLSPEQPGSDAFRPNRASQR